jgi:hypothetical protein
MLSPHKERLLSLRVSSEVQWTSKEEKGVTGELHASTSRGREVAQWQWHFGPYETIVVHIWSQVAVGVKITYFMF